MITANKTDVLIFQQILFKIILGIYAAVICEQHCQDSVSFIILLFIAKSDLIFEFLHKL